MRAHRRSTCACGGVGFWLSAFGCVGGDISGHLAGPGVNISAYTVSCSVYVCG